MVASGIFPRVYSPAKSDVSVPTGMSFDMDQTEKLCSVETPLPDKD